MTTADTNDDSDARDVLSEILVAARAAFRERVQDVRMQDVADGAGISRAYLYTFVPNREALIELALVERAADFGVELAERAGEDVDDLPKAVVELVLRGVQLALEDDEFRRLADALPRTRLAQLLNATDSPIHKIMVSAYEPLLARALGQGRLRTDVSLDRIYAWIQSVSALLVSRDDLDEVGRTELLRDFLLPSVLK